MIAPRGRVEPPRAATIEGLRVVIVEKKPLLPRRMDDLLAAMSVTAAAAVTLRGASIECEARRQHPFTMLREGRFMGMDIRIDICPLCGAACVRDVSWDTAVDGEPVRLQWGHARRRNVILGWYTGSRRAARQYK